MEIYKNLPDKATRSVKLRPTAENLEVIELKAWSEGGGIALFAPDRFGVRLSLLPTGTLHVGPPDWNSQKYYSMHVAGDILKVY